MRFHKAPCHMTLTAGEASSSRRTRSMWSALRQRITTPCRMVAALPSVDALPLMSFVRHHGTTMKRRFRGLFGGKHIQFGNKISFSHTKCAGDPVAAARARARDAAARRSRSLTPALPPLAGRGARGSRTCKKSASGATRTSASSSSR